MRVLPGDVLVSLYGPEGVAFLRPEERERIMAELGLSDPLYIQYGRWMKDVATLKLGQSLFRQGDIMDLFLRRGPITIQIAFLATFIAWLVGFPVGIIGAKWRESFFDYISRGVTFIFLSVPSFWLALLTVLLLVTVFHWKAPISIVQLWDDPVGNFAYIWGPALVLGLAQASYIARMTRSSLLEVISQDYIRTARSKGLTENVILSRHAIRNCLLPVLSLSGVLFAFCLAGSVPVEVAFGVKGLGDNMMMAIDDRDITLLQNLVLLYAIIFMLVNLFVDVAQGFLDPRIRLD